MSTLADKVAQIKQQLEYEKDSYETALAYPTENAQYYRALERQRQTIQNMEQELSEIEQRAE